MTKQTIGFFMATIPLVIGFIFSEYLKQLDAVIKIPLMIIFILSVAIGDFMLWCND